MTVQDMPNGSSEKLTAEQLDDLPRDSVVYVGPSVRVATPYKRVRGGWKRFYFTSFRAFGVLRSSSTIAREGAWGQGKPD